MRRTTATTKVTIVTSGETTTIATKIMMIRRLRKVDTYPSIKKSIRRKRKEGSNAAVAAAAGK